MKTRAERSWTFVPASLTIGEIEHLIEWRHDCAVDALEQGGAAMAKCFVERAKMLMEDIPSNLRRREPYLMPEQPAPGTTRWLNGRFTAAELRAHADILDS